MNEHSKNAARHALTGVALAAGLLFTLPSWALGLGRLNVQSALGESLRAEIDVTSITAAEAESLRLRVATPEAYRAAGVEFNPALAGARVQLVRSPDGRSTLRITSDRAVLEPFVELIVEANWSSGRLVREYTMLFDPPTIRTAQPASAPSTAPVIAPPVAPPVAAAPARPPRPAAPAPAPAATPAPAPLAAAPAPAPRSAPAPAPAAGGGSSASEVRVRPGDTLGRIAARVQPAGVSLDQMLVSLFRTNPQAFIGENMNRLRSGSVLSVPSADEAGRLSTPEAKAVIQAQAADFNAFRQRLASGTTARADAAPARADSGRVQTQVEDRRAAAAPAPDKLTLSRPGAPGAASAAQASQEAERKAAADRVAELARNVEDLKKLQGATAPATAPAGPAPAPAAAPVAAAPALPSVPVAPVVPPPAPASAVAAAPAPVAPPPAPAPAAPAPATAPVAASDEPGMLGGLLSNPLLLPGAGLLVLLLGGLGLYKMRGRRKQAGETSFLESRLQPDSFFGASGGQRIDTREAGNSTTGNSSSMSYSLSQLDAIGDVDPVAEADVYLAYGRDLQAEEILKEAMRSDPDRMAVRTKLLEVYAKRRDIKGFELLATQLFSLTGGQGEDWAKAQTMGLGIDPENPMYQPGGTPDTVLGAHGQAVEPLGASTVPYAAPAGPPSFQPAADATLDSQSLDLSLDLDNAAEATQPQPGPAAARAGQAAQEEPSLAAAPAKPDVAPDLSLDFDTDTGAMRSQTGGALDFDLGEPAPKGSNAPEATLDFGEFGIEPEPARVEDSAADALSRKLELAEEFRQIGDLEGARDLLEEVLSKADGALRAKAQGMLDSL